MKSITSVKNSKLDAQQTLKTMIANDFQVQLGNTQYIYIQHTIDGEQIMRELSEATK